MDCRRRPGDLCNQVLRKIPLVCARQACRRRERSSVTEGRSQYVAKYCGHFEQRCNGQLVLLEKCRPHGLPRGIDSEFIRQADRQFGRNRHPPPDKGRGDRSGQDVGIDGPGVTASPKPMSICVLHRALASVAAINTRAPA